MIKDIYGQFLKDFHQVGLKSDVLLHNNYGEAEELPVDAFFRGEEDMPDIEVFALNLCEGRILDIGAGTGTHSLVLQRNGFDVTAIELSKGACELMDLRGIKNVVHADVMTFEPEKKFDTLLMMMNGIGFCGYIDDLKLFLAYAKKLLVEGGQILFDSSDVAYLYEDDEPETESYYGEIDYQYEYNGEKDEWFSWLYVDINMMQTIAEECGWNFQVIYQDEEEHYLGRLMADPS